MLENLNRTKNLNILAISCAYEIRCIAINFRLTRMSDINLTLLSPVPSIL